jgi:hypothetical protein
MRRSTCNRLPGLSRPPAAVPSIPPYIKTALIAPRAGMAAAAAKLQMAEDFRATGPSGLTRDDLIRLGWTPAQIDSLSGAAVLKAQELAGPQL